MVEPTKQEQILAANAEFSAADQLDALICVKGLAFTLEQLGKVVERYSCAYAHLANNSSLPELIEKHQLEANRLECAKEGIDTVLEQYRIAKGEIS